MPKESPVQGVKQYSINSSQPRYSIEEEIKSMFRSDQLVTPSDQLVTPRQYCPGNPSQEHKIQSNMKTYLECKIVKHSRYIFRHPPFSPSDNNGQNEEDNPNNDIDIGNLNQG